MISFFPIDLIFRTRQHYTKSDSESRHREVRPLLYQVLAFIEQVFHHVTKRPLHRRCNKGDQIFPRRVVSDSYLTNKTPIKCKTQRYPGKEPRQMLSARCSKDNIYKESRVSSSISEIPGTEAQTFFETKRLISDLFCESGPLRPIL